jgi:hypothetical protein
LTNPSGNAQRVLSGVGQAKKKDNQAFSAWTTFPDLKGLVAF